MANWGTFITTPEVSATAARVNVKTRIKNELDKPSAVTLITKILDAKGTEVAKEQPKQTTNPTPK